MSWKTSHRSLYYLGAPEPDDPVLKPEETALLVIDIQNTYVERPERATLSP
jgi:biuret amidohydrolase